MAAIGRLCPQCKKYNQVPIQGEGPIRCPSCDSLWGRISDIKEILNACPVCQCRQFYTAKDFNQSLGCFIMLIGIILVPKTYGLSLPVFALIDWLLHKRVTTIVNCYKCGTEFRGLSIPKHLKPFMHHIGLKYDKYR